MLRYRPVLKVTCRVDIDTGRTTGELSDVTKKPLGKEALLDAAETLIVERGIEGASVGDIVRESGHRNRSALAYHFGTKDHLIRELAERMVTGADEQRIEMLNSLEAGVAHPSMREILVVTIAPMGQALETEEGRRRLRLLAQLAVHPRFHGEVGHLIASIEGIGRCAVHLVQRLNNLGPEIVAERIGLVSSFALRAFADRALAIDDGELLGSSSENQYFTATMTDLMLAMFTAPVTARGDL